MQVKESTPPASPILYQDEKNLTPQIEESPSPFLYQIEQMNPERSLIINNPWNVTDGVNAFSYFCCPECDERFKNDYTFIHHAVSNHEKVSSKIRVISIVEKSSQANFRFFHENVVVTAISELRPGSNERYENSTFYGPF